MVVVSDDNKAAVIQKALLLLNVDQQMMSLSAETWASAICDCFKIEDKSACGLLSFALAFPWRMLFAILAPPPSLCGGWPRFVGALAGIAVQVVLISDFASQMGCEMYLKDEVTAITFVALGTSLPDTFASMQAAKQDKTADNSIGNITGSNSVNVFFGLGVPWLLAAVYWASKGEATEEWRQRYSDIPGLLETYPNGAFVVRGDGLGFSVVVFTLCAICTIALILARRFFGGHAELGGNRTGARVSAGLLLFLWFSYLVLSSIKSYETELGLGVFGF